MLRATAPWNLMVHGGLRSSRSKVSIIAGTAVSEVSYESVIGDVHGLERNQQVLPVHVMSPSLRPFAWPEKAKERDYEHRLGSVVVVFKGGVLA